ncbi:LamB/YcsF family protein, partial [Tsukamurella asaccharolytica]
PNALITDHVISTEQVLQMVREQSVTNVTGSTSPLKAETICGNGDGVAALKFEKKISQSLTEQGIKIKA